MRDFSLKLFDNAYVLHPKTEQQLLSFLHYALVLNLLLPFYLIYTNDIYIGLLILLLDLVIVFGYGLYAWFNQKPRFRTHFTLSLEGVRYRILVSEPEQEFEWEEVDTVRMHAHELVFTLKNGEEHTLCLHKVQDEAVLRKAETKIRKIARRKDIQLL
ncbi:hypothetical protein [Botryobacter ruber]|uniref:hypothetical protein n=1 Tax=Botryobacter ruber TaxID=2171629 RepID=UPI000FEC8823|nr:hypothetical protein [Botryobacter ruber]